MSHSISSTFLPLEAMASARRVTTVDLPSLGTDEVMTTLLMGSSTLAKRMLAYSVLAAFCMTDRSTAVFFLAMVGTSLLKMRRRELAGRA